MFFVCFQDFPGIRYINKSEWHGFLNTAWQHFSTICQSQGIGANRRLVAYDTGTLAKELRRRLMCWGYEDHALHSKSNYW